MTNPTSSRGKNQAAQSSADLPIPTLGAAPAKTIVQLGEEPEAAGITGAVAAAPVSAPLAQQAVESFIADANQQPATQGGEMNAGPGQYVTAADLDARMRQFEQSIVQAIMARDRPVMARRDDEQFAETPRMTLEIPVDGSLDKMRRPDQRVEGVDIDVVAGMDHAEQLAFLEELVVVNVAETSEPGAENPVVLWVNGRSCPIVRGEDTAVKRKFVELLLRAKPEGINTRITRDGDGNVKNHVDKTRALKYPFSIVHDRNPRGRAWAQKIRSEA